MCPGSNTRIGTCLALGVAHITQPLSEETVGVGKEGSRLGKHLRVGHPSQALVALWAIGGHRQIVGTLSPKCIRNQFVHQFVARSDFADLQVLGNRGHWNRLDAVDDHIVGHCDRDQTITKEREMRIPFGRILGIGKCIVNSHACIGNTQVLAMHTALGTIHATALQTIAIVQQFRGNAGELCSTLGIKHKGGHGRAILAEVYHKMLTWVYNHRLFPGIFPADDHFAISR